MKRSGVIAFAIAAMSLGLIAAKGAPDVYRARSAFPAKLYYENAGGTSRLSLEGAMETKGYPFVEPLGPNGRACVTCHQPANAMSLAAAEVQRKWAQNGAKDPHFASIDGANCPNLLQVERAPHSLMIDCGLIRIARPWPVSLSPRSRQVKIA